MKLLPLFIIQVLIVLPAFLPSNLVVVGANGVYCTGGTGERHEPGACEDNVGSDAPTEAPTLAPPTPAPTETPEISEELLSDGIGVEPRGSSDTDPDPQTPRSLRWKRILWGVLIFFGAAVIITGLMLALNNKAKAKVAGKPAGDEETGENTDNSGHLWAARTF